MDFYEPHPFGILPAGNRPADAPTREARLGAELGGFDDALLTELFAWLEPSSLAQLGASCTGLYILVNGGTDAWRTLVVNIAGLVPAGEPSCHFYKSWRLTAISAWMEHFAKQARQRWSKAAVASALSSAERAFPGRPWFSDAMFQSWLCTTMPPDFKMLTRSEARAAGRAGKTSASCSAPPFRQVPRAAGLSVEEFKARYERPNTPVILTDVAKSWRLFHVLNGDLQNIDARAADLLRPELKRTPLFRCESLLLTLQGYARYAAQQRDERPVYLFDAEFMDGGSFRDGLWEVPPHFAVDDLFAALGKERPNYRWLIAGPARAGSSFHIDPNFTNAWNACLTGRKRWLLFPPNVVPPGVHPSPDMSDVATPVSLTEWLMNYYEQARREHHAVAYECVCEAGETIFVPCGWWHCVVNLEPSVAVTQNYVCDSNLDKVLKFLHSMPKSISGIGEEDGDADAIAARRANFFREFADKIKAYRPDLIAAVDESLAELEDIDARRHKRKAHRAEDAAAEDASALPAVSDTVGEAGFSFEF